MAGKKLKVFAFRFRFSLFFMRTKSSIKHPSTQHYLKITEIKEDTAVLQNGALRAVLLVSSINFALKSEEEQNAIIYSYISLLNSLEYPLEIIIQSRKLNIDNYLNRLESQSAAEVNELLKLQTFEYIKYIKELVELGEIMTKKFFLVVPYDPFLIKKKGFFRQLKAIFTPARTIKLQTKRFHEYKEFLDQRVNNLIAGFSAMGVGIIRLDTEALIELFYSLYNPESSATQMSIDINKLKVDDL